MITADFFSILDSVDSTNNYAMGRIHAGLAKHGMLWFTKQQTAGKGQRGKAWNAEKEKNITISLVLEPYMLAIDSQFHLSAAVSLTIFEFFAVLAGDETKIKWPNDLFWRDRKAGGVLIENIFQGAVWKWAVIGIGININQTKFDKFLIPAVSLKEITGKNYDTIELAKILHALLIKNLSNQQSFETTISQYQMHLYKRNEKVILKKNGIKFETMIKAVNAKGQLITVNETERQFDFGEVEWVI